MRSGNVNCGQWAQSVTVAADKFENAREGDRFKINLTINAGKGKGIVKVQSGDMVDLTVNGKGTNMDSAGNFKRGAKDAVYEINVTDLEKAQGSRPGHLRLCRNSHKSVADYSRPKRYR